MGDTFRLYFVFSSHMRCILIAHCINSYRDLMKEFSFSGVMANWLSYDDNRSLQNNIDEAGIESWPDENVSIAFITRIEVH